MSDDDRYGLDDSFGYWVSRLARAMRESIDRDFAELGVNVAHWAVLAAAESENGVRILELSRRIGIDPAGVTRLIDKLDAAGFMQRKADPLDKRAQRVELTDKGRELFPKLKALSRKHNAWWLEQLGRDHAEAVVAQARRVIENVDPGQGER